jgi:hypothetical protein
VRQGCRTLPEGQGCPFWQTPIKMSQRRKQAAAGGFLLDTFLCPHKEKYLAFGCENPIKTIFAIATPLINLNKICNLRVKLANK